MSEEMANAPENVSPPPPAEEPTMNKSPTGKILISKLWYYIFI